MRFTSGQTQTGSSRNNGVITQDNFRNDRDNRDLNALNLFIPNRAQIESSLQAQSKNQMQMWSSMRELFASVVYQSLNSSGVELIQVTGSNIIL